MNSIMFHSQMHKGWNHTCTMKYALKPTLMNVYVYLLFLYFHSFPIATVFKFPYEIHRYLTDELQKKATFCSARLTAAT